MKKRVIITSLILIVTTLIFLNIPVASMANVVTERNDAEKIKVFVGGSLNPVLSGKYKMEKHGLLKELAGSEKNDKVRATIVFNKLLNLDDAQQFMDRYGFRAISASFYIKGFTDKAITTSIPDKAGFALSDTIISKCFELTNDYNHKAEICSIDVLSTPKFLRAILEDDFFRKHYIDLIDVHYSKAAEERATTEGWSVSYILLTKSRP